MPQYAGQRSREEIARLLKIAFSEEREDMVDQGRILTPKSDETIMREAELLALRQMSDSIASFTQEMAANREMMVGIREDMAVIKERQRAYADVRDDIVEIRKRVDEIETRNAKQDGAMSFATLLKDFGPWIVSLLAVVWAFVKR